LHDITLDVTLRQLLSDYAETQNFAQRENFVPLSCSLPLLFYFVRQKGTMPARKKKVLLHHSKAGFHAI